MRILIVEDEALAQQKLENLLHSMLPELEIVGRIERVEDAVNWIRQEEKPDLAFFDIQLADDISFEIFEQCEVDFPVVFVTAYDSYLMKAFEVNSIHYLLKPISESKLRQALNKAQQLERHFLQTSLRQLIQKPAAVNAYKSRLIVRKGTHYIPLETSDVAYLFTEHKVGFAKDREGQLFMIDDSLTELEKQLDPRQFFRANRQFLIHLSAITRFRSVEQSKIELELSPDTGQPVRIGKENAVAFRKWIKGE